MGVIAGGNGPEESLPSYRCKGAPWFSAVKTAQHTVQP